jgi:hypothetical protein
VENAQLNLYLIKYGAMKIYEKWRQNSMQSLPPRIEFSYKPKLLYPWRKNTCVK